MKRAHYETQLEDALERLQMARQLLMAEIAGYPSPISGCDVQYNRLLSDRTRLSKAIHALENMPFVPTPRVLDADAISVR